MLQFIARWGDLGYLYTSDVRVKTSVNHNNILIFYEHKLKLIFHKVLLSKVHFLSLLRQHNNRVLFLTSTGNRKHRKLFLSISNYLFSIRLVSMSCISLTPIRHFAPNTTEWSYYPAVLGTWSIVRDIFPIGLEILGPQVPVNIINVAFNNET